MLNVLFTVDTETFPITNGWRENNLAVDMKRDLHGEIDGRSVGLEYQLGIFSRNRLKANFLVESLFSAVPEVGPLPLREIVRAISAGGHDIQVHPHTEWIPHIPDFGIPYRSHQICDYPMLEQEAIIRFAMARLEDAGAPRPIAFRAGGFAANADTLVALQRTGIKFDTSFNLCYQTGKSQMPTPASYGHVTEYDGVLEVPVAVFRDRPAHFRPAQLHACSAAEMIHALDAAERKGWNFFVIVSHSFEMVNCRRHATKAPTIRQIVVERFEKTCEFLSANRDRFTTVGFSDLDRPMPNGREPVIEGRLLNTAGRLLEQAANRLRTL